MNGRVVRVEQLVKDVDVVVQPSFMIRETFRDPESVHIDQLGMEPLPDDVVDALLAEADQLFKK